MERRNAIKGLAAALGGMVAIPGCKRVIGAECYDPAIPEYRDYVCTYCKNVIKEKYSNWMVRSIDQIDEIFKNIKGLGYDVVLDKTEFCPKCSKKEIQKPELIFKIRFSEEDDYHIVRSNIVNEYQCLYDFLKNPDEFTGDKTIIRKMTGLGEDLKIKQQ